MFYSAQDDSFQHFFQPRCKNNPFPLNFGLVKRSSSIRRTFSALALLLVFLFIHAVKAVHTHDNLSQVKIGKDLLQFDKSSDCAICDYHFTKEALASFPEFQTTLLEHTTSHPVLFQTEPTSSIGLSFSDRGPPARA